VEVLRCVFLKELRKTLFRIRPLPFDVLEQFLKSMKRFSDKNCGKNKELERLGESNETKTACIMLIHDFGLG